MKPNLNINAGPLLKRMVILILLCSFLTSCIVVRKRRAHRRHPDVIIVERHR